ncbi:glycosyltransferase [Corallococcus sicarius]|uniref:glycosyltransferase n=1 Tax=Corallococcus sicarius TaxID=2316726 RepID=UPI0026874608
MGASRFSRLSGSHMPAGMRVTLITFGTQGDVRPMVALAEGLARAGHTPVLVADPEFAPLVAGRGIEFAPLAGDIRATTARADMEALFTRGHNPTELSRMMARLAIEHSESWASQFLAAARDAYASGEEKACGGWGLEQRSRRGTLTGAAERCAGPGEKPCSPHGAHARSGRAPLRGAARGLGMGPLRPGAQHHPICAGPCAGASCAGRVGKSRCSRMARTPPGAVRDASTLKRASTPAAGEHVQRETPA